MNILQYIFRSLAAWFLIMLIYCFSVSSYYCFTYCSAYSNTQLSIFFSVATNLTASIWLGEAEASAINFSSSSRVLLYAANKSFILVCRNVHVFFSNTVSKAQSEYWRSSLRSLESQWLSCSVKIRSSPISFFAYGYKMGNCF